MDALVWVAAYELQSYGGVPFAVGQRVTWPISTQLNQAALIEHVGAETAARISLTVGWHELRPEDTVDHVGTVSGIEVYLCRLFQGHVVPGSVETYPVVQADGWEDEEDGVFHSGYLVTLTDFRRATGQGERERPLMPRKAGQPCEWASQILLVRHSRAWRG